MRLLSKKAVVSVAMGATLAALMSSSALSAEQLNLMVRSSAANGAQIMSDLWNTTHEDQISITVIPDNQMVTKLATGVASGDVPDMVAFDLIFMPDFMKAGFLEDLTADLKDDPNQAKVVQAYKDLASYDGKLYGTGFSPDVSVLLYNKDLFRQAGLDPESPPTTLAQLHEYAKKISALGDDIYGYYFSGPCGGCNIFTVAPLMWAAGATVVPKSAEDTPLNGDGIKQVLTTFNEMWNEGVIPEDAQTDTGNNFVSVFLGGKLGMQGGGGLVINSIKKDHPELDFGLAFLPGVKDGEVSSFVGGDVIAVPAGSKHPALAREFIKWQLTDEAQLEGLAKNMIVPSRGDLANNEYFQSEPRYITTAKAMDIGRVPYAFHFNDMVNSDASPWTEMLATAIFDGNVDQAIEDARAKMKEIANE